MEGGPQRMNGWTVGTFFGGVEVFERSDPGGVVGLAFGFGGAN